jgi:hypothetical protein
LLFGHCQDALEADHEEIAEQVRANVLGRAAHVLLLEAREPLADGSLDLTERLYGDREGARNFNPRRAQPRPGDRPEVLGSRAVRPL